MYAFIEGKVAEKKPGELVISANGVGYLLSCSINTVSAAPERGEVMRVYTYLSVREDAMELFGFATLEEKSMFERLKSVSGIGPKTALGILSGMPLKELTLAIVLGDITTLSRAPGVGKKTAQRIALELKDKVSEADFGQDTGISTISETVTDGAAEALMALQTLGYTPAEAKLALNKVRGQATQTDELIKLALRAMAGGLS